MNTDIRLESRIYVNGRWQEGQGGRRQVISACVAFLPLQSPGFVSGMLEPTPTAVTLAAGKPPTCTR